MPNLPYPYLDQSEFPAIPAGLVVALQGNYDDLNLRLQSAEAKAWPRTVTTLPTSPTNAQEVFYVADDTSGVIWHLKYRSAATGSYKWEFVGGASVQTEVDTTQTTASTSFAALATAGPSFTVPLAGDYLVEIGGRVANDTAAAFSLISYDVAATAAVDNDGVAASSPAASTAVTVPGVRVRRKNAVAASSAIVAKYRVTAGTGTFSNRWLRITPIRLG